MIGGVIRSMRQIQSFKDVHVWAPSLTRGTRGLIVVKENRRGPPPRPEKPIELFEFESCPYCRKVREVMTELDLSFITRTCAKGAEDKRAEVEARGGKRLFPFLVDPNTGTETYESEDIITYLFETYGPGRPGIGKVLSPLNTGMAMAASVMRRHGGRVRPGLERRAQPEHLLVLYNMEASPWCRKVREALNTLNLDYQVENVGKGSARRAELLERGGKIQVPYLVDPNTGVEMYESNEIVTYLEETYAEAASAEARATSG